MGRLATDRTDWTYIMECAEHGADHVRLSATAKAAKPDPEDLFPLEECPGCGSDLAVIKQQEPTEVLD